MRLHSSLRPRSKQSGFTLVEIAIVLVIIGLLLGGVLKGQALVDSARVKNLIQQSNSLSAAVLAYQDKFRALPGDDIQGTSHAPGSTGNGNGDGQITEYNLAPQHLAKAGFITGSYNGTTDTLKTAQGSIIYIYNDVVGGKGGNGLRFDNLSADVARQLDEKLDDGNYLTGNVRATAPYTPDTFIQRTAIFF